MYKFALLDPRPIPAAVEANDAVFASGQVLGVEVTVPALARRCQLGNIDPQHGCHRETYDAGGGYMDSRPPTLKEGESAIEFAARQTPSKEGWVGVMIPLKGSILATVRADLDSIGAMAVLEMQARYESLEPALERIALIARADTFARGEWSPGTLPTRENPWPEESADAGSTRELAAMAAYVADFRVPIAERVLAMMGWLIAGAEPASYREKVEAERLDLVSALETGQISHEKRGGVTVVETTHRSATMVGYMLAPVVVALNPEFRFQGGEPHRKFTVCQFAGGYVDLTAVQAELNELEPGWGGSPTIIGSPQGLSSILTIDEVVRIVHKNTEKT